MARRTRLSAFAAAAVCVSLGIGVAAVSAHTATFPTHIPATFDAEASRPGFYAAYGRLRSPRAACLGNRIVRLYFRHKGSTTLEDVARSRRDGSWALSGRAAQSPDLMVIKVARRRLRSDSRHRHICESAEDYLLGFAD
jgi:hypothetical protein